MLLMEERKQCVELLKIKDVARLLGISPQTVRRLVAKGEIPAPVKIGHAIRWPVRLLEQWLAKKCDSLAEMRLSME